MRKASASKNAATASQQMTEQFAELGDWRGALCERLRKLINAAEQRYGPPTALFARSAHSKTM
jgi:hypothetical protein